MSHPILAKRRQRGFSLAEVLVAVALLAVILLALFGLVSAGVKRAYSGKKMTEASVLAQHVMERANVYAPQDLLGAANTDTAFTRTWVKTGSADANTTPLAGGGTTNPEIERDEIRKLLVNADLPASTGNPTTLSITATAVPAGAGINFSNSSMVRLIVQLTWFEGGTRQRRVRLQALNLRTTP
jgi:prepilin-type N-terminal cleavage/methylation domain-containing protein